MIPRHKAIYILWGKLRIQFRWKRPLLAVFIVANTDLKNEEEEEMWVKNWQK